MILGTSAIQQALRDGAIICNPAPDRIEGSHIDVRIGPHYWIWHAPLGAPRNHAILLEHADPRDLFVSHDCKPGYVVLPPRGFVLAHTQEYIGTAPGSGLLPMLDTRSTLARLGPAIHQGAGVGDEGYVSRWTLELANPHDTAIAIPVGARVGSIQFHRIEGAALPYAPGTRYNVQPSAWEPSAMLPRKGNLL